MSETITFDNTHYAFRYVGWNQVGTFNATRAGTSGTLALSKSQTASVTFTFPQPATYFSYWGTPQCCGGRYEIWIDQDSNNPQYPQYIDSVDPAEDGNSPPMILFEKTFDGDAAVHKIIVRNTPDPRFQEGTSQITLDRFELRVPRAGSTTTAVVTTTEKPPDTSSTALPIKNTANPIAPAVGGAFGGVALLFLLLGLASLLLRCRRKQRQRRPPPSTTFTPFPTITTTILPVSVPPVSMMRSNKRRFRQIPNAVAGVVAPVVRKRDINNNHGDNRQRPPGAAAPVATTPSAAAPAATMPVATAPGFVSNSNSQGVEASVPVPSSSASRRQSRDVDAGPLMTINEDDEMSDLLPPEYDQVFNSRRQSRRAEAEAGMSV